MVETQITSYLTGQLTPQIISELQMPATLSAVTNMIVYIMAILILGIFVAGFLNLIKRSANREDEADKSKYYRALMTDMYVVGMVKKFAKEDNVDIKEELKEFTRSEKKKDSKGRAIDNIIEDNLNEKIDAKTEKELEKIEGKF